MATENQKVIGAVAVGGLLGWLLHTHRKATGNVNLHFNPTSVQYDVVDDLGNTVVPQNISPSDATLTPGSYIVDMVAQLVF